MLSYFAIFPEKRETELRSVYVPGSGNPPYPPGTYVFTEFYCNDLSCDCQRVLVKVLYSADSASAATEVATISYTWNESPEDSWQKVIGDTSNPFLDPFHRQAKFAKPLMEFWHQMLGFDPRYAARLKQHYAELRRVHGQVGDGEFEIEDNKAVAVLARDVGDRKRAYRALRKAQKKGRLRRRSK